MDLQETMTQVGAERVTDTVRDIAARSPGRVAIDDAGRSVSYRELVVSVDRIAAALRDAGVVEGALVGHCFQRTADAVAALLGILEAGASYVPVDPRYPIDRIRFTLTDADVALVLADAPSISVLEGLDLPVNIVEDDAVVGSDRAREQGRRIEDGAYVVYTSGSTGRPKGVAIGHEALSTYAAGMRERLHIREDDRYLHTASFSFSSSVRQWVIPLTSGATLVMAGRQQIADARALLAWMKQHHVTVADLVPSYLRGCVQALREEDAGTRRALLDNELRLLLTRASRCRGVWCTHGEWSWAIRPRW
jgi:non-ribosomal peptide synthetase component F